jgi:hypothetical protein
VGRAENPDAHGQHARAVALEQDRERRLVTVGESLGQRGVRAQPQQPAGDREVGTWYGLRCVEHAAIPTGGM